MEEYSFTSHQRALAAAAAGRFDREIVPLAGVSADKGPRADTTLEKMAALNTLTEGGRLTAAVCSQISDGAAALLIASEQALRTHGLIPRARIHHVSAPGADPVWVLTAPIPATGHPLGASGARLMTTLLNELERTGGRYGLQTMCEGGGQANATIIERLT